MLQINLHVSAFPQADRMRFAAQEMIIRFLEPALGRGQSGGRQSNKDLDTTAAVLKAAYDEARYGVQVKLNAPIGQHVAATLTKATEIWKAHAVNGFASKKLAGRFEEALAKFAAETATAQCQDCQHDHLCEGLWLSDGVRIDRVPRCLMALRLMVERVATFVGDIYQQHLSGHSCEVELDIYFAGMSSAATRVTGRTEFVQPPHRFGLAGKGRPVWVELQIPVVQLKPDSYFSIIYVIAHEIAVHAVQELWGRAVPASPKRVAFPEGLVDRVIFQELIKTIRRRGSLRETVPVQAIRSIESFHATRRDEQERAANFWSIDVDWGKNAYEFLLTAGEFATRTSGAKARERGRASKAAREAEDWAHAIVLRLNLVALKEEERQLIAERLAEYSDDDFPISGEDWATPVGRLILALNDFEAEEDPDALALLNLLKTLE